MVVAPCRPNTQARIQTDTPPSLALQSRPPAFPAVDHLRRVVRQGWAVPASTVIIVEEGMVGVEVVCLVVRLRVVGVFCGCYGGLLSQDDADVGACCIL